ncbi:MAG TPA: Ku protein [Planctomycetaceae bacterium]|nr:Ku protein [Planctomycetaceae bacterium]
MAPRPAWKGHLRISLVTVPVQAFTGSSGSTDEGSPIRFNQLHRDCHSRIKYVKTCPIHGEVPNDEIVSGYEYAKGQYVEINPDELAELRPEGERAISVEGFVHPETIDPAYLSGKSYYLTPDGTLGQKPYQLIEEAMAAEGLEAIARMKITTREHLARVRAEEGLLIVDLLQYAAQVKDPAQFREELVDTHPTAPERKLTRQLITSMVDDEIDLSEKSDAYTDRVRELIEAKVQGKQIVTPTPVEEPPIVNIMDALKQSMKEAGSRKAKAEAQQGRPPVKSVARRLPSRPTKKKKSG